MTKQKVNVLSIKPLTGLAGLGFVIDHAKIEGISIHITVMVKINPHRTR